MIPRNNDEDFFFDKRSFTLYCNLSASVALKVRFTANGICAKNNTHVYVARTSNNRVIAARALYCCLLPQCEALCICRSGFPIAINWCCDQDVKVVPCETFAKKDMRSVWFVVKGRGCCCNLSVGVALNARITTNGMCAKNNTHIHVARTSNNRVIATHDLLLLVATVWSFAYMPLGLSDDNSYIDKERNIHRKKFKINFDHRKLNAHFNIPCAHLPQFLCGCTYAHLLGNTAQIATNFKILFVILQH